MKKILGVILIGLVLTACTNPKNVEIPADTEKWGELKSYAEKLNAEDKELFAQFMARKIMGSAFGGSGIEPGTTIGEAIEEQKKWKQEKEAQQKAEVELKAKIDAEKKAKIAEINKIITVALIKKEGYSSFGGIIDQIGIEIALENKGDKDIAGVKGVTHFNDIFGDQIKAVNLSYDQGLKAGSTSTYQASISYNQFMSEDKKLLNTELSKIKFTFEPQVILFADGSKIEVKAP